MEKSSNKNDQLNFHSSKKKKKTVSSKKKTPSTLSSEALLEEILSKKQSRKSKVVEKSKKVLKKEEDKRSNEEILEDILLKKKKKKKPSSVPTKHKGKIVSKEQVSNEIVVNVVESYPKEDKFKPEEKITYQEILTALQEQEKIKKKPNKILVSFLGGALFLLLLSILLLSFIKKSSLQFHTPEKIDITYDNRPFLMENCMQEVMSFEDNLVVQEKTKELNAYLASTYKASVSYEVTGYHYHYRSDQLYYAASTIKALDALYIYTQASYGNLSLDETMIYSSKYQRSSSKGLATYSYGSSVSLRDLVKYAVIYSDNSAHIMLLDYIGKKNLQEFGLAIGVLHTLSFSDPFGYLTSGEGLSIMRGVHEYIENNGELGKELQSYFLSAEQNDLEMPDNGILAAHKYGEYASVYHDMGIVYDKYPYIVAIFTSEGNKKNHEDIIRDIHSHVYDLHQTVYAEKENICRNRIYQ